MSTFERVVVIGGSIAGLATAATLADRAREVVVLERRDVDPTGSVAPQGHLPHVLLVAGARVLEQLFPGFAAELVRRGAHQGGTDPHRLPCHWVAAGAARDHLCLPDLGFPRALCSRGLVETRLREVVAALPNVELVHAAVEGLAVHAGPAEEAVVTGVRVRGSAAPLETDLVVDAGGRTSRADGWLSSSGVPGPEVLEVVVDLRYTAFHVERRPEDLDGAAFAVIQNTSDLPRIGVALPMEGDRWQVVLGGYFGQAAPVDPAGARDFARSLTDPALVELLGRPFLDEPSRYTFRSSRRRRWDKLPRAPRGYCAVGDSVASFNPIYGQGMTSALLQAEALGAAVDRHGNGPGLTRAASRSVARVADGPWTTATGADFIYAATAGRRPPGNASVNRYVERVTRAAAVDESVNRAFTAVQQLLAAPQSLFGPAVMTRVLRHGARSRPDGPAAFAGRSVRV